MRSNAAAATSTYSFVGFTLQSMLQLEGQQVPAELLLLTTLHRHVAQGVCAMGHSELTERTSMT